MAFGQLILLEEWHHLLNLQSKVLAVPIEGSGKSGNALLLPTLVGVTVRGSEG